MRNKRVGNFRIGKIWAAPVAIVYLIGGTLQFLGLLSVTQTSAFALLLFLPIFMFPSSWRQLKFESLLMTFAAYVIIFQLVNRPPVYDTLTYLFYIMTAIIAAAAGRQYSVSLFGSWTPEKFFRFTKWFLVLQLFVVTFQSLFAQTLVRLARVDFAAVDAVFGTFFLKSDAVLAAACELLVVLVFSLPARRTDRIWITALSLAVVFVCNSHAAQAAIVLVVPIMILRSYVHKIKFHNYVRSIALGLAFVVAGSLFYYLFSQYVDMAISQVQDDYYNVGRWDSAPRFAPLGQISIFGFDWFGAGPLTYYNPITKTWLYNSGFSTVYSLYIDYGAIGLSLYFIYQSVLILSFAKGVLQRLAFFLILMSFCMLNLALSDIGFIFILNFTFMAVRLAGHKTSQISTSRARVFRRRFVRPGYSA